MKRHEMQQAVNKIDELPTLPAVAMAVNRMLQDVNAPIEKMVAMLEKDQSLALRLLRLVNSSFYGFKSRITSLRHAVTLMGYSTVQHAVVTVSVIDCLKISSTLNGFKASQFWTHSIGVAVMCRYLANRTKLAEPEEAFTAGLVHDLGKVVLINHFTEEFAALLARISADEITFYASEKSCDTYPHTLIGGHLAKRWMLPEALQTAIRHHHGGHTPATDNPLVDLVAVADSLINTIDNAAGHQFKREEIPAALREPIIAALKLRARWFPLVKEEVAAACDFLL
ncbi:MAG: HDOD domain-containing protein [Desulfosarcinaceae bacterium]